jgi:hypothetical protein
MATITTDNEIKLNIAPLFDKPIVFCSYHSEEAFDGKLPEIIVKVQTQEDVCKVLDVMDFSITNKDGWNFKFKAYVYDIAYDRTIMTIKFYACLPEFVRENHVTYYKGIKKALAGCWPHDVDKKPEPDLSEGLKLYQKNESNFNFLTNIMHSWKFNTVWGYGLGRITIRCLDDWTEEFRFSRKANITPLQVQALEDPKLYNMEVEVLEEFENHKKIKYNSKFYDVEKEYVQLITNRMHNARLTHSKSDFKFFTRFLPPVFPCQTVTLESDETDVKHCFIVSRVMDIEYTTCMFTYVTRSIDP